MPDSSAPPAKPAERSVLASLAVLKVNYEERGRDYLDNFILFVVEGLKAQPDDVVSLQDLQRDLKDRFGLSLPLNPLRQVLQRAARDGYLRRDSGVYYRVPEACAKSAFLETRSAVDKIESRVLEALRSFAKVQHGLTWDSEQAERALLGFVATTGLDVLFASAEDSVLPAPSTTAGEQFVVATFVDHVRTNDPDLFDGVETIIKGAVLANALYLPDPGKIAQRFRHTKVYLDTSFLIYAIGYAGPDRQGPCKELVELLAAYGAELRCFQMTLEEARGVLDACAARMRRGDLRNATGPVIEYLVSKGMTSTDMDLMAARLPSNLAKLGVKVDDRPDYKREYVIDEEGFEKRLQNDIHYAKEKALRHDVECVAAIARLRQGQESFMVEDCRAIFVTTNAELARSARGFFQPDATPGAVALCLSDHALGNLLWLKNPTKAPDLPRRRLIADAFAAMEPPDSLWKAYLVEIARLEQSGGVSGDDYMLLRHSHAAKAALMDLTKGDVSAFTQGRVPEILEVAKRNLRSDLTLEVQHERELRERGEANLAAAGAATENTLSAVRRFSTLAGKTAGWICFGATLIILGLATLYTFPWTLPAVKESWLQYTLSAVQVVLFLYVVLSMGWGTTIKDLTDRFGAWVGSRVEMWVRRTFSI